MSRTLSIGVGQAVREFRQERGLMLKTLAKMLGITSGALSHLECGNRKINLDLLEKIARKLGTSASEIILRADRLRKGETDAVEDRVVGK